MPAIAVKDLEKSFGDVSALAGVSFSVEAGEVVGLVGPNGAGKTTTVDVLTGQQSRDAGNVSVLGMDPEQDPVGLRKRLGILPEREDPPSFLTGREYLDFVARVRETDVAVADWVDRFLLEGKLDMVTMELSKGERQKLMLIQAFFHDPELVFIDEPLINLDPVIQERAKAVFREYRDAGGTLFLCTHMLSLASEVCDRVFMLKQGRIVNEFTDMAHLKEQFLAEA